MYQATTLMYISEKISYKIQSNLNIYNPKQLESIFIEILRPDHPGGIVGTIYKHPSMSFPLSIQNVLHLFLKTSIK